MNVSSFIAKRYLFSKKSRNIINIISFISFFGLLISSAALVIILSGFNGIQSFVEEMYGDYSADIFITPKKGKSIEANHAIFQDLEENKDVLQFSKIIEETALIKKEDLWVTSKIKGVDTSIYSYSFFSKSIIEGEGMLYKTYEPMVLLGHELQYQLQVSSDPNYSNDIEVYGLSRKKKLSIQSDNLFNHYNISVSGIFTMNPELDKNTIFAPYDFVNSLFGYDNEATSIEVNSSNIKKLKELLVNNYSDEFKIETNEEKNTMIYATNETEKWMVLFVLIFILMLSTFNTMASITMLIIDKKKDINSLISIGSKYSTIRNIFFKEGLLICLSGSLVGLTIGVIICLLQNHFHFIEMKNAAINYWPVLIKLSDIILILLILLIIGISASFIPSQILMKRLLKNK